MDTIQTKDDLFTALADSTLPLLYINEILDASRVKIRSILSSDHCWMLVGDVMAEHGGLITDSTSLYVLFEHYILDLPKFGHDNHCLHYCPLSYTSMLDLLYRNIRCPMYFYNSDIFSIPIDTFLALPKSKSFQYEDREKRLSYYNCALYYLFIWLIRQRAPIFYFASLDYLGYGYLIKLCTFAILFDNRTAFDCIIKSKNADSMFFYMLLEFSPLRYECSAFKFASKIYQRSPYYFDSLFQHVQEQEYALYQVLLIELSQCNPNIPLMKSLCENLTFDDLQHNNFALLCAFANQKNLTLDFIKCYLETLPSKQIADIIVKFIYHEKGQNKKLVVEILKAIESFQGRILFDKVILEALKSVAALQKFNNEVFLYFLLDHLYFPQDEEIFLDTYQINRVSELQKYQCISRHEQYITHLLPWIRISESNEQEECQKDDFEKYQLDIIFQNLHKLADTDTRNTELYAVGSLIEANRTKNNLKNQDKEIQAGAVFYIQKSKLTSVKQKPLKYGYNAIATIGHPQQSGLILQEQGSLGRDIIVLILEYNHTCYLPAAQPNVASLLSHLLSFNIKKEDKVCAKRMLQQAATATTTTKSNNVATKQKRSKKKHL